MGESLIDDSRIAALTSFRNSGAVDRCNRLLGYPKEVIFRLTKDDQVQDEQITTVEEAAFGQEIEDKLFTVDGLTLGRAAQH